MVPNRWGQGQLFAFSALEGPSLYGKDLAGYTLGDCLGIRFFTKTRRELKIAADLTSVTFRCVTGDTVLFDTPAGEGRLLFVKNRLAAGDAPACFDVTVSAVGTASPGAPASADADECVCLLRRGSRFAFAAGDNPEQASALASEGLDADLDGLTEARLFFYETHAPKACCPYPELYGKALSVMRTQIYSPEGEIPCRWSTPDRLPHRKLWLWDSVFHAVGWRNADPALAEELILAVFAHQRADGFIPHMAAPGLESAITQPPILGWGALKVFEKSGNRKFLEEVYLRNFRFLDWLDENRRRPGQSLCTWHSTEDENCRCDESGMDNSSRFDTVHPLLALDFACYMANEFRSMGEIARLLGREEAALWQARYDAFRGEVNCLLWSEKDGLYYDFDLETNALHPVRSVASFLPLFAGLCDQHQAERLIERLHDPGDFGTAVPVPSISRRDPVFGSDMWRGPVWINMNYMIAEGLEKSGFPEEGALLRRSTLALLDRWYKEEGTIYEFYDCDGLRSPRRLNRKGAPVEPYDLDVRMQAIRDYGWSSTLAFDLLSNPD